MMKRDTVYYTFIESDETIISAIYAKIEVNKFDALVCVLGPSRVDHKKNVQILKQFMERHMNNG